MLQSGEFRILREDLQKIEAKLERKVDGLDEKLEAKVDGLQRQVSKMKETMAVERVKLAAITGGFVTLGNVLAFALIRIALGIWTGG